MPAGKIPGGHLRLSKGCGTLKTKMEDKSMEACWQKMYDAAMKVAGYRPVSEMVEAGGVAAAVETNCGSIYVGVCVDTACTLGVCAERNAIFNMITNGESCIRRVLAVNDKGKAVPPCGACRELMVQMMPDEYRNIEIMLDCETGQVVTLGALTPNWWL